MSTGKCSGCGFHADVDDEDFCFECRTYFQAGHVLTLNLCAWLERWRVRHHLTRARAVRVARESLEYNDELLIAAMSGEDLITR